MFGQSLTTRVRDTRLKAGHSDVRVCANARPTGPQTSKTEKSRHMEIHICPQCPHLQCLKCTVLYSYCTALYCKCARCWFIQSNASLGSKCCTVYSISSSIIDFTNFLLNQRVIKQIIKPEISLKPSNKSCM